MTKISQYKCRALVGFALSQIPARDLKRLEKKILRGDKILLNGQICESIWSSSQGAPIARYG